MKPRLCVQTCAGEHDGSDREITKCFIPAVAIRDFILVELNRDVTTCTQGSPLIRQDRVN
jgi:hypothetical protein